MSESYSYEKDEFDDFIEGKVLYLVEASEEIGGNVLVGGLGWGPAYGVEEVFGCVGTHVELEGLRGLYGVAAGW